MRVDPNNGPWGVSGVASQKAARAPRLEQDELVTSKAEAISRALELTPAVRAEEVARAKSLIQDTSYPPEVIIKKIASLLAIRMTGSEGASGSESS